MCACTHVYLCLDVWPGWLAGWLPGRLVGRLTGLLAAVGRPPGQPAVQVTGWLTGRPAGRHWFGFLHSRMLINILDRLAHALPCLTSPSHARQFCLAWRSIVTPPPCKTYCANLEKTASMNVAIYIYIYMYINISSKLVNSWDGCSAQ